MITKLEKFCQIQLKKNLPDIRPGDTVQVHQKIKEKKRERIQILEGVVIAKKHGKGISATITVRKVISGVGVEKVFPLHSPTIEKIEVEKKGKVYVTGKIEGKNKAEVQQIVKQMGFTWSPSINNRLTHLVYGKNPGQKKIDLAKRYDINLIKWADFIEKYKVEIKSKRIIVLDDRTDKDTSSPLGKEDIIELTQNKKWEVRSEAYKELINFNEDVIEILFKALADKSEKIRMMSLEELRKRVSEEEMFKILTKALADKSEKIREIALEELKKRDPDQVPYLLYELTKHEDKRVASNSFWIYNREQYKDKVKHLVELLDLESNVSVQQMAFAELVRISPPNLEEILVKGLYIGQLSAVRKSLELLMERKHPKLAELLLDGIFVTFFGYKFFPYLESNGYHKEILEKAIDLYDTTDKTVKGRIRAKLSEYNNDERVMNILEKITNYRDSGVKRCAERLIEEALNNKK